MAFGFQNDVIVATPTGRIDSAFLDGNDGSNIVPVWAPSGYPSLTGLQVGTAFSIDLAATGLFTDPGSPTSELGFYAVSGQKPLAAGFSLSGTVLSNSSPLATSGSFQLVAVRNGVSKLSPTLAFQISAPAGTDLVPPTVPTGITMAPGSQVGTIALSCDAPSDIGSSNAAASGSAHIDVYVNGTKASPPSPILTPANALAYPSVVNLGAIASPQAPTFAQNGSLNSWIVSVAGTGIAATAAEQAVMGDFGTYSGARRVVGRIPAYSASSATALCGLIIHDTAVSGGKFVALGLRPTNGTTGLYAYVRSTSGGTSTLVGSLAKDFNGNPFTGTVRVKAEIRGDPTGNIELFYALDDGVWHDCGFGPALPLNAPHIGTFGTSQNAGTAETFVIDDVSITDLSRLTATISATAPVSVQLQAVDADGNASAKSTALTGTPSVPVTSGSIKWFPGHHTSITTRSASSWVPAINAVDTTVYKGVQLFIPWAQLESTQGNYTIGETLLDQIGAACLAKGLVASICIVEREFAAGIPGGGGDGTLPGYLGTISGGGGGWYAWPGPGDTTWTGGIRLMAKLDNSVIYGCYQALILHFGAHYEKSTQYANQIWMFETNETAVGIPAFDTSAWNVNLQALIPATRNACATMGFRLNANFTNPNSELDVLKPLCKANKWFYGGPDPQFAPGPGPYSRDITADEYFIGAQGTTGDYRGLVPFIAEQQELGFNRGDTPQQTGDYYNNVMQCSVMFWVSYAVTITSGWPGAGGQITPAQTAAYIKSINGAVGRPNKPAGW